MEAAGEEYPQNTFGTGGDYQIQPPGGDYQIQPPGGDYQIQAPGEDYQSAVANANAVANGNGNANANANANANVNANGGLGAGAGVCTQTPGVVGTCKAYVYRWTFNAARGNTGCYQYQYGGCGGNGNNFATHAQCAATCPISVWG